MKEWTSQPAQIYCNLCKYCRTRHWRSCRKSLEESFFPILGLYRGHDNCIWVYNILQNNKKNVSFTENMLNFELLKYCCNRFPTSRCQSNQTSWVLPLTWSIRASGCCRGSPTATSAGQRSSTLGGGSCSAQPEGRDDWGAASVSARAKIFAMRFWEWERMQKLPPKRIYHPLPQLPAADS